MRARHEFDTIIVGGGPGGSTAGALLARAGHKVLILEKLKFPRFRIGESLLPFGNDVLKASGAWPKIESAGFIPKLGAEFIADVRNVSSDSAFVGNDSKKLRFWFRNSLTPDHAGTFQVERAKFDEILLDHARECGCEVRQEAARTVQLDDTGVRVNDIPARWLVDASGRETFLGNALRLPRRSLPVPKRIAVYAHFTGVTRNTGEAAGHISIVRLKDGWFWFIPIDAEKTSVGMVRSLGETRDVNVWFEETVAGSTDLRNRMAGAQRVSELMTTSDYTYRYDMLAQPRAVMVGDAGGFIDPIFSSGVFIALSSAKLASEMILRADGLSVEGHAPSWPRGTERTRRSASLQPADCRRYSKEVHRMMDVYFKLIVAFYDNAAFEVFMNPVNYFQMLRTMASVLAGNTERSFAMWWRMQLFYAVCRLQRHFPLAPRLNWRPDPSPSGGFAES